MAIYRFGDFELDDRACRLRRRGEAVGLQPRAFDLLSYLVRHPGRLVTKAELLGNVWGVRVVEKALPKAMRAVRRALDEDASRPTFIETVRSRGYRFATDVQVHTGPLSPDPEPSCLDTRLDGLSEATLAALHMAAVAGRAARLDAMADACAAPREELLACIDEARRRNVLRNADLGRVEFADPRLREQVAAALAPSKSTQLHAAYARALEALDSDDPQDLYALAHHYSEAAALDHADEAVHYNRAAGAHAHRALAFDRAADHYRCALAALALLPSDHEGAEPRAQVACALRLGLGRALQAQGMPTEARDALLQAADLARSNGDASLLGRVAIHWSGHGDIGTSIEDERLAGLLQEARGALDPGRDDAVRARVLSKMVVTQPFSYDLSLRLALSDEAQEAAARSKDPVATREAMVARFMGRLGPAHVAARLGVADALVEHTRATHDEFGAIIARELRCSALLALGRPTDALRDLAVAERLIDAQPNPTRRWSCLVTRASDATTRGDAAAADGFITEARRLASDVGLPGGAFIAAAQRAALSLLCEPSPDVQRSLLEVGAAFPRAAPLGMAALVYAHAATGDLHTARSVTAQLPDAALHGEPDENWLMTAALLTLANGRMQDRMLAERLHALLAPFAQLYAYQEGLRLHLGPVTRFVGVNERVLDRLDDAMASLTDAVDRCHADGCAALEAHARIELARTLQAAGRSDHADEQRAHAARTVEGLALPHLQRLARREG